MKEAPGQANTTLPHDKKSSAPVSKNDRGITVKIWKLLTSKKDVSKRCRRDGKQCYSRPCSDGSFRSKLICVCHDLSIPTGSLPYNVELTTYRCRPVPFQSAELYLDQPWEDIWTYTGYLLSAGQKNHKWNGEQWTICKYTKSFITELLEALCQDPNIWSYYVAAHWQLKDSQTTLCQSPSHYMAFFCNKQ